MLVELSWGVWKYDTAGVRVRQQHLPPARPTLHRDADHVHRRRQVHLQRCRRLALRRSVRTLTTQRCQSTQGSFTPDAVYCGAEPCGAAFRRIRAADALDRVADGTCGAMRHRNAPQHNASGANEPSVIVTMHVDINTQCKYRSRPR